MLALRFFISSSLAVATRLTQPVRDLISDDCTCLVNLEERIEGHYCLTGKTLATLFLPYCSLGAQQRDIFIGTIRCPHVQKAAKSILSFLVQHGDVVLAEFMEQGSAAPHPKFEEFLSRLNLLQETCGRAAQTIADVLYDGNAFPHQHMTYLRVLASAASRVILCPMRGIDEKFRKRLTEYMYARMSQGVPENMKNDIDVEEKGINVYKAIEMHMSEVIEAVIEISQLGTMTGNRSKLGEDELVDIILDELEKMCNFVAPRSPPPPELTEERLAAYGN